MQIAIYTLGCKVNQYETAAMERELLSRGHELVDFAAVADAYIINTCSVTAVSDKKSRQMIRRARKTNPQAIIAVCGCYAQTHVDEVKALAPDLLMGTGERNEFLKLLEQTYETRVQTVRVDDALRRREFEVLSGGGMASRTRAMLKVEDGCVNFCTYCIIPFARGPVRSLPLDEAAKQTRELLAQGYREIVVTGIEISSYGHDLKDGTGLIDLLETIAAQDSTLRIRLGSLEPRTVTREFCERAVKIEGLCPHFHLSLQSGCDETLRRMNRKYDTARFYESVELLREFFPDVAITTDLITGFPGETEEEFAATLAFIEKCAFADMHVFPYSIRPGTKAAAMPQVDMPVREERAARASAVAAKMNAAFLDACVGKTFSVLFEQDRGEGSVGHAMNYMEVVTAQKGFHNALRNVRITGVENGALVGEIV